MWARSSNRNSGPPGTSENVFGPTPAAAGVASTKIAAMRHGWIARAPMHIGSMAEGAPPGAVSAAPQPCPAALRIRRAIASGCEISERWLESSSIVVAPIRLAMKRSRSGLMVRSCVDTA